jgi:hypothetical protein
MERSTFIRNRVSQGKKLLRQFATNLLRMTRRVLSGRQITVALGNCPLTTGSMIGRMAILRFSSPSSSPKSRTTPDARKKSPMPSGLKRKQVRGFTGWTDAA